MGGWTAVESESGSVTDEEQSEQNAEQRRWLIMDIRTGIIRNWSWWISRIPIFFSTASPGDNDVTADDPGWETENAPSSTGSTERGNNTHESRVEFKVYWRIVTRTRFNQTLVFVALQSQQTKDENVNQRLWQTTSCITYPNDKIKKFW
jgi:hypothetical protein